MDLGYNPQQFVGLFDDRDADESEFVPLSLLLLRVRGQCSSFSIKGRLLFEILSLLIILLANMEVVIDVEFLRGRANEIIVKEISIAAANVSDKFPFMTPHGSVENGQNWYDVLYTVASKVVAVFAHFYACKMRLSHRAIESPNSQTARLIAPCHIISIINTGVSSQISPLALRLDDVPLRKYCQICFSNI